MIVDLKMQESILKRNELLRKTDTYNKTNKKYNSEEYKIDQMELENVIDQIRKNTIVPIVEKNTEAKIVVEEIS